MLRTCYLAIYFLYIYYNMYSYGQGINGSVSVAKRKPKKRVPTQFELDNYHVFGKFILNRRKLNENVLLIKYPKSMGPIARLRATTISDSFKNLINDILDTQRINIDLQRDLEGDEDKLFETLLHLAGLKQRLQYQNIQPTMEFYVKRFNILKGSLIAGNDSVEVKDELENIISLLSNPTVGKISPSDAVDLINALK